MNQTSLDLSPQDHLHAQNALLSVQLHLAQEKIKHYEQEIKHLTQVVLEMKRTVFGKKTERFTELPVSDQLGLFNEVEVEAKKEAPEEKETLTYTRTKKGHGGRKPLPEDLPREEVVVDLPEEKRFCPHDGHPLHEAGEDVSEKLKIVPAQMSVVRTTVKKYACRCCESHMAKATPEPQVLSKTIATNETLAWIIQSKFDQGLPLYRLESFLEKRGVDLSRTTMARWLVQLVPQLMPIWNVLEDLVLSSGYAAVDATRVQVLKENGRAAESPSSMWARGSPELGIVLFDYDPSEGGAVAEKLFSGFSGYLQSDQHQGYNRLNKNESILRLGCWAHCRRRFFSAKEAGAKSGSSLAAEGLRLIQQLYKIEEVARDLTTEERRRLRQEKARPLLGAIHSLAETHIQKVPATSLIGKALNYTLEQWPYLSVYIENPRLQIDNNWLERQIRLFAIGRKNWLFSDTPEGAHASALFYSFVVTAKLSGKDPHEALLNILRDLPKAQSLEDYERLALNLYDSPAQPLA